MLYITQISFNLSYFRMFLSIFKLSNTIDESVDLVQFFKKLQKNTQHLSFLCVRSSRYEPLRESIFKQFFLSIVNQQSHFFGTNYGDIQRSPTISTDNQGIAIKL